MGCNGGLMDQAFQYIKVNNGIDSEAAYPYEARDGNCRFSQANIVATDAGFKDIIQGDEYDLQNAIATIGPISVAIDASLSSFHFYTWRRNLIHGSLALEKNDTNVQSSLKKALAGSKIILPLSKVVEVLRS